MELSDCPLPCSTISTDVQYINAYDFHATDVIFISFAPKVTVVTTSLVKPTITGIFSDLGGIMAHWVKPIVNISNTFFTITLNTLDLNTGALCYRCTIFKHLVGAQMQTFWCNWEPRQYFQDDNFYVSFKSLTQKNTLKQCAWGCGWGWGWSS